MVLICCAEIVKSVCGIQTPGFFQDFCKMTQQIKTIIFAIIMFTKVVVMVLNVKRWHLYEAKQQYTTMLNFITTILAQLLTVCDPPLNIYISQGMITQPILSFNTCLFKHIKGLSIEQPYIRSPDHHPLLLKIDFEISGVLSNF